MPTEVIAILALLAIIIIGVVLVLWAKKIPRGFNAVQKEKIRREWSRILGDTHREKQVMDADKLLHTALKLRGYSGTMGDILKTHGNLFTSKNDIWTAHKIRNTIAHESFHTVKQSDCSQALRYIEKGLKDLHAL